MPRAVAGTDTRLSGLRSRARSRWERWASIARLLPDAGWPVVWVGALVNLAAGALPIGFIIASSVMLSRLAISRRPDSAVWIALVLAVVALVLQALLSSLATAITELVSRRIDGECMRRLMAAAVEAAPLQVLERQDVLDKLSDARAGLDEQSLTPGAAAAALLALVGRYTQLAGAVIVLAVVAGPLAGAIITVTALVVRFGQRGSLARWAVVVHALAGARRRARYIFGVGSDLGKAKELRVLSLLPWLRERASSDSDVYLAQQWSKRRRLMFAPFVAFSLVALVGGAFTLLAIRSAVTGGHLSVLALSLAVQAVLVPMRFGVYFPDCDVQTQYGMLAQQTLEGLEALFGCAAGCTPSEAKQRRRSCGKFTA